MKPFLLVAALTLVSIADADEVHLFVLAGQSNAVGSGANAAELPSVLRLSRPDIRFWYEVGDLYGKNHPQYRRTSGNQFVALQYQNDPQLTTFDYPEGFGAEITLGRALADMTPEPVAILKLAFNGTNLHFDWHPDAEESLYPQLLAELDQAQALLNAQGHPMLVSGCFWMQGEGDAQPGVSLAYETNLLYFIQRLRSDLLLPRLPFVLGQLHPEIWRCPYGITQSNLEIVRTAQLTVAAQLSAVIAVGTADLPLNPDWIHFPALGQRILGERFAVAYQEIVQCLAADLNADGRVDGDDVSMFIECRTGADVGPPTENCATSDLDRDGDVDQTDFGLLQVCYGGPQA